jgi:hypothetical protein
MILYVVCLAYFTFSILYTNQAMIVCLGWTPGLHNSKLLHVNIMILLLLFFGILFEIYNPVLYDRL